MHLTKELMTGNVSGKYNRKCLYTKYLYNGEKKDSIPLDGV